VLTLVLAEITCPDYLAETAAGVFPFGYDIPQGGITRIDGCRLLLMWTFRVRP